MAASIKRIIRKTLPKTIQSKGGTKNRSSISADVADRGPKSQLIRTHDAIRAFGLAELLL